MNCEHCNGPQGSHSKCCWLTAVEIRKFRQRVLYLYIIETLFDMIVSTISVVLDIITLVHYTTKGKWELAILTAIPILLPTTVFTNVYMRDSGENPSGVLFKDNESAFKRVLKKERSTDSMFGKLEERVESADKLSIFNCIGCCSGALHSIFHKDRNIRKRGAKLARKSIRRSAKYLFGTLVLRFIAWSWYLKALTFGIKAMREPKRFMKIAPPDTHWSRELLIRLDFLQAALENAPQCVLQLYTLLTDSNEDQTLGILTLAFSFIDFVRVVTTVFWNINKGPVVAPDGSYGENLWKFLNITSWVFIYTARCCAVALIIGTAITASKSERGIIAVPVLAGIIHCVVFAKLFSSKQLGQASQKLIVTTFISLFFLPELDSNDVHVLVQFYYALILLENTIFTVPYKGLEFPGYCLALASTNATEDAATTSKEFILEHETFAKGSGHDALKSKDDRHCLIDPWVIVFLVPALTITGSVVRLLAYQKMAYGKRTFSPQRVNTVTMEERVATIYNKKWTTMTVKEMWDRFMRMLRKEEQIVSDETISDSSYQITGATPDLQNSFQVSQDFIRKSISTLCMQNYEGDNINVLYDKQNRHLGNIVENAGETFPRIKSGSTGSNEFMLERSLSVMLHDNCVAGDVSTANQRNLYRNFLQVLDVRFLKVETPSGTQVFETVAI